MITRDMAALAHVRSSLDIHAASRVGSLQSKEVGLTRKRTGLPGMSTRSRNERLLE